MTLACQIRNLSLGKRHLESDDECACFPDGFLSQLSQLTPRVSCASIVNGTSDGDEEKNKTIPPIHWREGITVIIG